MNEGVSYDALGSFLIGVLGGWLLLQIIVLIIVGSMHTGYNKRKRLERERLVLEEAKLHKARVEAKEASLLNGNDAMELCCFFLLHPF